MTDHVPDGSCCPGGHLGTSNVLEPAITGSTQAALTAERAADKSLIAQLVAALEAKAIAYHAHMIHLNPFAVCEVPTCEQDRAALAAAREGK